MWCDSRVEHGVVDYRQYLSEEAARFRAFYNVVISHHFTMILP
ncbi:MAG: hypothetical protein ABFS56_33840 [Pseudomonadota bacterium]